MPRDIPHRAEVEIVDGYFKGWRGVVSDKNGKYYMVSATEWRDGWCSLNSSVVLIPVAEADRYLKILKCDDREQEH